MHKNRKFSIFTFFSVIILLITALSPIHAVSLELNALAGKWTEYQPDPSPLGRIHSDFAFDTKRGKAILFGGNVAGSVNDTWEFDTTTYLWKNLEPSVAPPVLNYHKMVYHPIEDIIILFGGITGNSVNTRLETNVWVYNITDNIWIDMGTPDGPSARRDPFMVYNSDINKIHLFGGMAAKQTGGMAEANDLWEYDYNTNTWTELITETSPPPRGDHQMVYDPLNKVTILFGGNRDSRSYSYADTWIYDHQENTWNDVSPVKSPEGRWSFLMRYNSINNTVILVGGNTQTKVFHDTWSYNYTTNNWKQMHTQNEKFPQGGKGTYDSFNNKIIWFGGTGKTVRSESTWILDFYDGQEYIAPETSSQATESTSEETIYIVGLELIIVGLLMIPILNKKRKLML